MSRGPWEEARTLCPRCGSHAHRNGRGRRGGVRTYICQNYHCRYDFDDGALRRIRARPGSGQIAGRRAEIEFRPLDAARFDRLRELAEITRRR